MDLPDRLEALFRTRRSRNPHYSLRALGRDLGVDHASLSQVLARRRPASERLVRRLAGPLGLDAGDVTSLVAAEHGRKLTACLRASDVGPSVRELAERSGLSMDAVCVVLQRLLAQGALRMASRTRWELTEAP